MTTENIILLISVLFINLVVFYLLTKDKRINEIKEDGKPVVSKRFKLIYGATFVIINIAIAIFFMFMYSSNSVIFSLKRFCVLSLLWPIGLIDYKTYRIPNVFILMGLFFRVILIVPELIFERAFILGNLIAEVVAAVAIALAAFICSICMKNSIGYGDIKLFIVMGLLLGMNGIWSAVFVSLIIAFFVVIFLLITRKKGKKDIVPFAPAIMVGTYISVILTGM